MHCTVFLYTGITNLSAIRPSRGNEMRQENLDQRLRGFTVILVSLASCVLALCAAQGILGYPFRKTIGLDAAKFLPVEGFAYSAPLLPQYSPRGWQSMSARVYEENSVSSLYSQRA